MSPETTLPYGRIVAAADSATFARAPIASRILPPPIVVGPTREDELTRQLAEARAEGYAAGLSEASAEPQLEIERERLAALQSMCSTISASASALAADRRRLSDEMTGEIADLAFAVVEAALGANFAGSDELRENLRRALEIVPANEAITVRVHPDSGIDAESISSMVETDAVSVIFDPTIERSGCVVEAGPTRIDAQIATAMERVERVFSTLRFGRERS